MNKKMLIHLHIPNQIFQSAFQTLVYLESFEKLKLLINSEENVIANPTFMMILNRYIRLQI